MHGHHGKSGVAALALAIPLMVLGANGNGDEVGASSQKPIFTEKAYSEVVQEAVKNIQGALETKATDKATPALIRCNALLIAAAAQDGMGREGADVKQLATLRDAALRLIALAPKKKFNPDEAKKQAAALENFPKIATDPSVKTDLVSFKDQYDIADVMNVFDKKIKGGQGLEVEILSLEQQKKPYTPAQMSDHLLANAYKTALLGRLTLQIDDKAGDKKKEWQGFSDDMAKATQELIQATQAQQSKAVKVAVKKLNASCAACHEVFK